VSTRLQESVSAGHRLPGEVAALLNARDEAAEEEAWKAFVEQYSRLFLHTIHRTLPGSPADYDHVMNCYAYVLDQLRQDGFHRLCGFDANGSGKFTTWIVFVVRRLCVDCNRNLYGRATASTKRGIPISPEQRTRRRLTDLIAEELDLSRTPDPTASDPELEVRRVELSRTLEAAVQGLSGREQLLLKLRFQDELTGKEIARVVGLASPFHVYRKLNSLFGALRKELRGNGIHDSSP